MESFYPAIKAVHVAAVTLSGLLFAVRGAALNLFGASWPKAFPVRLTTWAVDTVLLAAALMLTTILDQYPFRDAWLTTKVALLAVYVGLGTVALKPQRPKPVRLAFYGLALLAFLFVVAVARAKSPLGPFA